MINSPEPPFIYDIEFDSHGVVQKKTLRVNLIVFSRRTINTIFQVVLPGYIALLGLGGFIYSHDLFFPVILILGSFFLYKTLISLQKIEIHDEKIIAKSLIGQPKVYFATNISNIRLNVTQTQRGLAYGTSINFNDGKTLYIPSFRNKTMHEIITKWSEIYHPKPSS